MPPRKPNYPYGALLREAVQLSRVREHEIAKDCSVVRRTVARWLAGDTMPNPFQARNVVYMMHRTGRVPRELLVQLAEASGDDLESLSIERSAPLVAVPAVPPDAQKIVDDAVREAAEALDVPPRALRPIAQRMFEALATGKVPVDAAARLAGGARKG